jgi:hypothetical protein
MEILARPALQQFAVGGVVGVDLGRRQAVAVLGRLGALGVDDGLVGLDG